MANITKTTDIEIINLQSVPASSVLKSTVIDMLAKYGASIGIHFGRLAATAAGAGAKLRVEWSPKATGDGHWYPLVTFETSFTAVEPEAVTGANNAGQNVVQMASTLNLVVGGIVILANSTVALSEFHRIKKINANVSVELEDNLANAQNAGSATLYAGAEMFTCQLDLLALKRIRIVDDASLFTQAHAIEAHMITGDSIA